MSKTNSHPSTNVLAQVRWVDASDMGGCGITTGMKKVLALATKARSGSAAGPSAAQRGRGTKTGAGKAKADKKRKGTAENNEEGADEEGSQMGSRRAKKAKPSSSTRGGR